MKFRPAWAGTKKASAELGYLEAPLRKWHIHLTRKAETGRVPLLRWFLLVVRAIGIYVLIIQPGILGPLPHPI